MYNFGVIIPHPNRHSQPKRKVQKKKVEKKSVRLVTKWVPKASLSNTTASTSSGNTSVTSDSSGNSHNSVEVNTIASNNSSGNSHTVTTEGSSLRKPIITKYSSHEIPSKDYLLKLNRLAEYNYVNEKGEPKTILAWSNQGRRSSLWHVDSGCSRHRTGIMSLLEDFKKFEGGHVAFGDNPTGGKISGKGKVSKGKMTFDDVYYVEQLRYNLLSVSQVCDKKFGVFFTDTECLILAPGFKIDESQVMLRTPRKDNVYCLDIEDASSLSSLNCLSSKASVSESSGFEDPKYPDKVYKLRKTLYGLHQAPRAWYDTLSSYLLENKFERGVIDKTLFIKRTKTDILLVQIYVVLLALLTILSNTPRPNIWRLSTILSETKLIQVLKVHTDDQYAYLFTKAFDVGRFTFLVTGVGMMNSE
ncbi:hypothetical protein OSB04_021317 [Centaurea solstitialis]|uniref:Uncharacterized protein n=1 Tax=Centaurea solstitialis TaxID=347529 RepID=A0AA38STZ0_9ASTR|nr:hypothetical protein OSB04_021317 [Centaurea solstitialis]